MPTPTSPPIVVALDDCDEPADALDALILGEFVAGRYPASVTVHLPRVRPGADLLPPDPETRREARTPSRTVRVATGPGWIAKAVSWRDTSADVTVAATGMDLAVALTDAVQSAARDDRPADSGRASIGFWHSDGPRTRRTERRVDVESWSTIRDNFTSPTARQLDALAAARAADLAGRLLLLHGPPGTGKTTALLALADSWRDWCTFDYVLDPELLLARPSYLMEVVLPDEDDDRDAQLWRMVLLEDCDELIRSEAKAGAGQALARLLNLTDGVVGRGLRTLVCVTTNEDVGRLHPAVIRPGRCLANVHVGRLSERECTRWLGDGSRVGAGGATLAELVARRNGRSLGESDTPRGMYL